LARRSKIGIVYSDIDVKGWQRALPSAEAVRPAFCPCCGAASRPVGGALGLHGHGLRGRQQWGPREPRGRPQMVELALRRYRCVRPGCRAVLLVGPTVVRWRFLYSASAIALALAGWGVERRSAGEVRAQVSVFSIVGAAARGWTSLVRWAHRARELFPPVRPWPPWWPPRLIAERAARTAEAMALVPSGVAVVDAFSGAARAL
jgi:hypothetical protein